MFTTTVIGFRVERQAITLGRGASTFAVVFNQTRQEVNEKQIPGEPGHWVAKFHYFSPEEQEKVFEKVIALNKWASTDCLVAKPDEDAYSIISYNGEDTNESVTSTDKPQCSAAEIAHMGIESWLNTIFKTEEEKEFFLGSFVRNG